jgi:hypothetical protein
MIRYISENPTINKLFIENDINLNTYIGINPKDAPVINNIIGSNNGLRQLNY